MERLALPARGLKPYMLRDVVTIRPPPDGVIRGPLTYHKFDTLRAGRRVTDAQVDASRHELLSRLSSAFGDEFVERILSNES